MPQESNVGKFSGLFPSFDDGSKASNPRKGQVQQEKHIGPRQHWAKGVILDRIINSLREFTDICSIFSAFIVDNKLLPAPSSLLPPPVLIVVHFSCVQRSRWLSVPTGHR